MNADFIVRSITVAEVVGDDGDTYLTLTSTGDPADWQVIGMLAFALSASRADATWPDD